MAKTAAKQIEEILNKGQRDTKYTAEEKTSKPTETHRFQVGREDKKGTSKTYTTVRLNNGTWQCSCPGWLNHRTNCKHIRACMSAVGTPPPLPVAGSAPPMDPSDLDAKMKGLSAAAGLKVFDRGDRSVGSTSMETVVTMSGVTSDCLGWFADGDAACKQCKVVRQCKAYARDTLYPYLAAQLEQVHQEELASAN